MSTAFATIDTSRPSIPFARLVKVELRKSVDTLAGRWLLAAIAIITVIVNVVFLLVAKDGDKTFFNFMAASGTPQGFLLPILGILLVTSEWSQRTAMVTFSLSPRRMQTVLAKIVAAVILATLVFIVAIAIGVLMTAIGGGTDPWNIGVGGIGQFYIGQLTGVLQGVAFGLLILNSAGAIVASFAVPIVFSILTGLWSKMSDLQPWIDLGTAQGFLFSSNAPSGEEWAQIATSTGIWVVLPLVLGVIRLLRAEVK